MVPALFINGVFEAVLEEIIRAQKERPTLVCYLQPHSARRVTALESANPSVTIPVPLYASTTTNLGAVCYKASIVGWENKQSMSKARIAEVSREIARHQPDENELYTHLPSGKPCVNLLSIVNLVRLPNPISVTNLVKVNDGTPVKPRTQAGGWSYVKLLPDWIGVSETHIDWDLKEEFQRAIERAQTDTAEARGKRLAAASSIPVKVQVISYAFRRNPDVVAEVLLRAKGKCESCNRDAPFLRASDGSPFLEIHHKVPLAEGGDDTVSNAVALCPNCHRRMHYGMRI